MTSGFLAASRDINDILRGITYSRACPGLMLTGTTCYPTQPEERDEHEQWDQTEWKCQPTPPLASSHGVSPPVGQVVHQIYKRHCIRRCKPTSSLFRISDRLDLVPLVDCPVGERSRGPLNTDMATVRTVACYSG